MGFLQDFVFRAEQELKAFDALNAKALTNVQIARTLKEHALARTVTGSIKELRQGIVYFNELAQKTKLAKVIRVSGEQCKVFLDIPRSKDQDSRWLRLPFEYVWLALDCAFPFKSIVVHAPGIRGLPIHAPSVEDGVDKTVNVRGVLMEDISPVKYFNTWNNYSDREPEAEDFDTAFGETNAVFSKRAVLFKDGSRVPMCDIDRMIGVHFLAPLTDTFNEDSALMLVMKDGTLRYSMNDEYRDRREAMLTFAIHMINFLSSPSVKLVQARPDPALQKARVKRGKEPLPGWYEISYSRIVKDHTTDKVAAGITYKHSFRYDVRGHFMTFTKGRMAGRVIWCPPHQRGLANEIYKPKAYRTHKEPAVSEELYKG